MRAAALAFLLVANVAFADDAIRVRVTGIADGDTLYVRDPRGRTAMVWIDGIDAPENRQPYGARSRYSLRNLVSMRTVTVIPRSIDGYGRIVGKVLLGDLDIGLEQVRLGMAWYDDRADLENARDRIAYEQAEASARREGAGLWKGNPVPPWEYRRTR
jgi:endonuclease YncB( thermonuclease family)